MCYIFRINSMSGRRGNCTAGTLLFPLNKGLYSWERVLQWDFEHLVVVLSILMLVFSFRIFLAGLEFSGRVA